MDTDDVVAIQQLLALYGHAADEPTQELLSEVFTPDAVFESRGRGRRLDGLDAIKAWFAEGKPPHPPAHQTTNVYVYERDDEVRVRSKFIGIDHASATARTGDYDDVVVKTDRGWRIARRVSTLRFGRSLG